MPLLTDARPAPPISTSSPPPVGSADLPAQQLARASGALWLATLALMTAFMHNPAPAHRTLLARRISRNFETLASQDCFAAAGRASFSRLARRWRARAEQLAPERAQAPGGPLQGLF
jgi:hypothetical protein